MSNELIDRAWTIPIRRVKRFSATTFCLIICTLSAKKTLAYLDSLTDDELNDCPENCEYTRLELILMQFRHISVHTGMLNGQTIERTGRFPVYVGPTDSSARLSNGHFEE